MEIEAALTTEQGVTFVVASVKPYVLSSPSERASVMNTLSATFGGALPILMGQTSGGRVEYYGRDDIVRFLSHIDPVQLPWATWSV